MPTEIPGEFASVLVSVSLMLADQKPWRIPICRYYNGLVPPDPLQQSSISVRRPTILTARSRTFQYLSLPSNCKRLLQVVDIRFRNAVQKMLDGPSLRSMELVQGSACPWIAFSDRCESFDPGRIFPCAYQHLNREQVDALIIRLTEV